jgi:hypothetical protein
MTGSFWAALLLAPVATAFFGILMERFLLRKIHAFGLMSQLILTVGVSLVILAGVKIFWGTESLPVKIPPILSGLVMIGGMDYPLYRLFIIGLSLVVLACMTLLLYKTRLGKIVRAAVSDADMVNALGINIPLVFTFVFGVGIWLAGVAGIALPFLSCLAGWLLKHGFKKVNIPEFMLFDGEQNISSVFQKEMKQDETLAIGKWGVLVLAGKDAKLSRLSSVELAADPDTLLLWDTKVPFPSSSAPV